MGTALSLVVGYGCEWTHLPFTMPLEVWTVKVQHTDQIRSDGQHDVSVSLSLICSSNRFSSVPGSTCSVMFFQSTALVLIS